MKAIGLDIGTTTISGVLINADNGSILDSKTIQNTSEVAIENKWEKVQSPNEILKICRNIIDYYKVRHKDIIGIGITGQMHGILYCDKSGKAVSNFYTWQDMRGNLIFEDNKTYAQFLTQKTGYFMSSGFGMTTHFYNQINGLIPENAAVLCNIQDYITMNLSSNNTPFMHPSNAASFGLFDIRSNRFDAEAIKKVGISEEYLPKIHAESKPIGKNEDGIFICSAIGDNQASFFGSVADENAILVNVGTGSQVSAVSECLSEAKDLEYRPYLFGNYLTVGCGICGGYSYNLLRNFFEQTLEMFGVNPPKDFYETMNTEALKMYPSNNKLKVNTQFRGTRKHPELRGNIGEISSENFTPQHLVLGFLEGICEELYNFYKSMFFENKTQKILVGSGNGIRKNLLLQKIFEDRFKMELKIPKNEEEAAFGAGLFCLYTTGYISDIEELRLFIKYN